MPVDQMSAYRQLHCVLPILALDQIVLEFHNPYRADHETRFQGVLSGLRNAVMCHELRRVLREPYDSIGLTLQGVFVMRNRQREFVIDFAHGHVPYLCDYELTHLNEWSMVVGVHHPNK